MDVKDVIDDRVLHIIGKIENSTLNDVVEELALDSDVDELLQMRKDLFILAKDRLEYTLCNDKLLGEEEDAGIELANRTNRSQGSSVAKEVVEQYKYVMGMTNNFPRAVLSN